MITIKEDYTMNQTKQKFIEDLKKEIEHLTHYNVKHDDEYIYINEVNNLFGIAIFKRLNNLLNKYDFLYHIDEDLKIKIYDVFENN